MTSGGACSARVRPPTPPSARSPWSAAMTSGGACSLGSVVVGRGGGGGVGGGWIAFVSGVSVVWEVALMSRLSSFISRLTSFFWSLSSWRVLVGFCSSTVVIVGDAMVMDLESMALSMNELSLSSYFLDMASSAAWIAFLLSSCVLTMYSLMKFW